MTAASLGHDEVVEALVKHGANRALRDNGGKTAADLAPTETLRAKLTAVSQ
jgi:ankyrin repeat protein